VGNPSAFPKKINNHQKTKNNLENLIFPATDREEKKQTNNYG